MRTALVFLFGIQFTLEAGADPAGGRYALKGIESNYQCSQAKLRNPAAVCAPKVTVVPEEITIDVDAAGKNRTFEIKSKCRTMRGTLKVKEGKSVVAITRDSGACGGRSLSLQHEAVFNYMRQVASIDDDGSGGLRARINEQTALLLSARSDAAK